MRKDSGEKTPYLTYLMDTPSVGVHGYCLREGDGARSLFQEIKIPVSRAETSVPILGVLESPAVPWGRRGTSTFSWSPIR